MHVAGQEMGVGMVLAVAVYQLGWFDAAMVQCLVIIVVVCVGVFCMWLVRLGGRESPFLPASKAV